MTETKINLRFEWPTNPDADMRTFTIHLLPADSSGQSQRYYKFYHPVTGLNTGATTCCRKNFQTGIDETVAEIDWSSRTNANIGFGLEKVHIRELRKPKKSSSKSRRFKAGGHEYKWKIANNNGDLFCVDSKGKTVANWTQDGLTLSASSKVEPVLDRIVVTCFLNLWIRHLGQW